MMKARLATLARLRGGVATGDEAGSDDGVGTKVFGVPLADLARRPALMTDGVPSVFRLCCRELQARGLDAEGLFRLSASRGRVKTLADRFDAGDTPDLSLEGDIHTVAGLLKLWLREIPGSLFTEELYDMFLDTMREEKDPLVLRKTLQLLVFTLPAVHVKVIDELVALLHQVQRRSHSNKMDAGNLAVVLAPGLIRQYEDEETNLLAMSQDTPALAAAMERVIRHREFFFPNTAWWTCYPFAHALRSRFSWVINVGTGRTVVTAERSFFGRLLIIVEGGEASYALVQVFHPSALRVGYRIDFRIGEFPATMYLAPWQQVLYVSGSRVDTGDMLPQRVSCVSRFARLLTIAMLTLALVAVAAGVLASLGPGQPVAWLLGPVVCCVACPLLLLLALRFIGGRKDIDLVDGIGDNRRLRHDPSFRRASADIMDAEGGQFPTSTTGYVPLA